MTVSREVALATGCNMTIAELMPNISNISNTSNISNASCVERLLRNDMVASYCGMCREEGGSCNSHALLNSFQVVEMISLVGPIITAGEVIVVNSNSP